MTIVYIEVSPKKLSNREVSKVYDTYYRQGKLATHEKLTSTLQKAQFIRDSERFVTLRLPDTRIPAFLARSGITHKDINTVRGGTYRDLDALEAQADSDDELSEYKYPTIKLEPGPEGEDLSTTILNAIHKMDNDPRNLEEGTGSMDISMAVRADSDDEFEKNAVDAEMEPVNPEESSSGWDELDQTVGPATLSMQTSTIGVHPTIQPQNDPVPVLMTQADQGDEKSKMDIKLDAGGSIPVWKKSIDKKEEVQNVRLYIRDLKRLKSLQVLRSEALLINASLVKSGRTSLYEELPKEAEDSVDEFVKYLQVAYGLTRIDMMRDLQNVRQQPNESPYTFMSRIITLYYEARGEPKKTISQVIGSDTEKFEITKLFLDGLYDSRISVQLQARLEDLKFSELAANAKNAESALQRERLSTSMVNNVEQQSEMANLDQAVDVMNINSNRTVRRDWRNVDNNNKPFMGACFVCGKQGHRARDCRNRYHPERKRCFNCYEFGHTKENCRFKHPEEKKKQ